MPEELKYKPKLVDRLEGVVKFLTIVLSTLVTFYAGMIFAKF